MKPHDQRPARHLTARVALPLLVSLGLALAPIGVAQAASGPGSQDVTWAVRTASNQFGADRTSYSYTVNPGTKIDDALVIGNHGDTPLDLGVYAADGYTTDSGQFDLVVGGATSVGVGDWVRSSSDHITVAPGETLEVPFSMKVPRNATPGDYAGGIVTSLVEPDDSKGINVDRRLGIRITLRVGGDITPRLAIEDTHVDWDGGLNPLATGDATVTYTIHNTGNATLSATQAAAVTGLFGSLPHQAKSIDAPPQLLPGERWKVSIPVPDVPAMVVLTATATVTPIASDASGSTTALTPVEASANGWAVPVAPLLLMVALGALVFLALAARQRLQSRQKSREDARVKEAIELALGNTAAAVE
ncbi:MAG TPA: DUF916 domain-containing protein [Pseudolysinimonas sp.]|nr:DUF916 domain-containing protein [Pseudolysinimonas sp.]